MTDSQSSWRRIWTSKSNWKRLTSWLRMVKINPRSTTMRACKVLMRRRNVLEAGSRDTQINERLYSFIRKFLYSWIIRKRFLLASMYLLLNTRYTQIPVTFSGGYAVAEPLVVLAGFRAFITPLQHTKVFIVCNAFWGKVN